MRYRREDVVARAVDVLDTYGLADLTMRRLGAEIGVQPSALYHHFADKQTLLAAAADEILARASWPCEGPWEEQVVGICATLRDAVSAYRDGAELVATMWSFDLGARAPYERLLRALDDFGPLAAVAARTLLHFVYGHAVDEQTHLQAAAAGAISDEPRDASDFETGLAMVVAGIQVIRAATASV